MYGPKASINGLITVFGLNTALNTIFANEAFYEPIYWLWVNNCRFVHNLFHVL